MSSRTIDGRRAGGAFPPALAVVLIAAVVAAGVVAARRDRVDVRSPGGLALRLTEEGAIDSVAVGGRTLAPGSARGGFTIRPVGGMPNLLPNPGFEEDEDADGIPDGWTRTDGATEPRLAAGEGRGGDAGLSFTNGSVATSGAVETEVEVEPDTEYSLRGWIRVLDVRPSLPSVAATPPRIEAVLLSDGRVRRTWTAFGYTDSADWSRHAAGFRTGPDVDRVRVRVYLKEGSGSVWFDDLYLGELLRPERVLPARATSDGDDAVVEGRLADEGLGVRARLVPTAHGLRVRGEVSGPADADRAFQVTFAVPVNARGWRFPDDMRSEREIEAGAYSALSAPPGQTDAFPYGGINLAQRSSRYPFGGIHDERSSIAIGVPLTEPRIFRIAYDVRGLSVTFDLATSPDTTRLGNRTSFSFLLYSPDPAWGFRSMAEGYYRAFADTFERRTDPAREGTWFFAPPLDSLPGDAHRDFMLGLNTIALGKAPPQTFSTWGTKYVRWSNERNLYVSAYNHHWGFYQPMRLLPDRSFSPYRDVIEEQRRLSEATADDETTARLRNEASAARYSTSRDVNGRPYYEYYPGFFLFYQNLDSVRDDGADWPEAVLTEQVDRALRLAQEAGGTLDGIHLDSTSGARRWGAVNDYDRRHWAVSTVPLTFSYATAEPALLGILQMHAHLARMADLVRDRGLILSANFNSGVDRTAGWVGTDSIDYFGIEQGLPDKAGGVERVDALAMLKRTLAYQRPVTSLDTAIADGSLSLPEIEERIEQALFYAIYPGAWIRDENENDQVVPTWSTPEKRAVYAPFAPWFRALGAAGWEPVTHARSSDPAVWLERYGSGRDGDLHLAVRNETDEPRSVEVSLDLEALGLTGSNPVVRELVHGAAVSVERGEGVTTVRGSIAPRTTLVLRVESG